MTEPRPDGTGVSAADAPASIEIRRYTMSDADDVRALFIRINRLLASAAMRDAFESYIARSLREEIDRIPAYYGAGPAQGFWVAIRSDGVLVGMFGLEPRGDDTVELRRMYVAPEARRRGLARRMLEAAERLCRLAGRHRLILSTSELQSAALALYRQSGYRLVREEIATTASNKTVGANLRRFHFEKTLEIA